MTRHHYSPRLVAIGGFSGSGKSTLARALLTGPFAGALLLRTDVIRKELHGVAPETRLPPEAYTAEASARVYATLRERAAEALRSGRHVIVDAVSAKPEERAALEALAEACHAEFDGLWLEAPAEILEERISGRLNDPSDATVDVMRRQLGYAIGDLDWRRIDARGTPDEILSEAKRLLGMDAAHQPDAA